jgi:hypothetical protein
VSRLPLIGGIDRRAVGFRVRVARAARSPSATLWDVSCWSMVCRVGGGGCGRVAARLTYGAQAPDVGVAPGDKMIDGVIPARGGAAAQSDWAVRGAGASVSLAAA